MNGREKIAAALSTEGTPEIPVVIPYEGILIRDHWADLSALPWWAREDLDVAAQAAWRGAVAQALEGDWAVLPAARPRAARESLRLEPRADGVYLVDGATGGARRLRAPEVGGWTAHGAVESVHPERPPEPVEEVEARIPAPAPLDARRYREEGRADLADALLAGAYAGLYPIRHVSAPLWGCYGLWGYEGLMVRIATAPDLVAAACDRFLALALRDVKEAAILGATGVFIEDCLTDQIGLPAFRRLNVAYLRPLTEAIRAVAMQSIYYYCGDPAGKWEALLDVGADALALEESKKGFTIDIEEAVERVGGRCALLGNLDAIDLLPHATEEALAAEIRRQIAAGRRNGGRFVMSPGSPVTPGTSVERVRTYCRLARALGA